MDVVLVRVAAPLVGALDVDLVAGLEHCLVVGELDPAAAAEVDGGLLALLVDHLGDVPPDGLDLGLEGPGVEAELHVAVEVVVVEPVAVVLLVVLEGRAVGFGPVFGEDVDALDSDFVLLGLVLDVAVFALVGLVFRFGLWRLLLWW